MQVQIILSQKNRSPKKIEQTKQAGVPISFEALPSSHVQISVDGHVLRGSEFMGSHRLRLARKENHLVIESETGEPQIELLNFYDCGGGHSVARLGNF